MELGVAWLYHLSPRAAVNRSLQINFVSHVSDGGYCQGSTGVFLRWRRDSTVGKPEHCTIQQWQQREEKAAQGQCCWEGPWGVRLSDWKKVRMGSGLAQSVPFYQTCQEGHQLGACLLRFCQVYAANKGSWKDWGNMSSQRKNQDTKVSAKQKEDNKLNKLLEKQFTK